MFKNEPSAGRSRSFGERLAKVSFALSMVVLNGGTSFLLATLPYVSGNPYMRWSQGQVIRRLVAGNWGFEEAQLIGPAVGGILMTTPLYAFLRVMRTMPWPPYLLTSGCAGVVFGLGVFAVTIVLVLLAETVHSAPEWGVVLLHDLGIILAAFPMAILFSPILILGGATLGLLNGVLIRLHRFPPKAA